MVNTLKNDDLHQSLKDLREKTLFRMRLQSLDKLKLF